MSAEEKVDREKYWVLAKIREEALVTTSQPRPIQSGSVFVFSDPHGIKVPFRLEYDGPETMPRIQSLVFKLAEEGIVRILNEGFDDVHPIWYCTFAPLNEGFEKLYRSLDERFSQPPFKPVFHFRDGYLFRDGCDEHKKFSGMEGTIMEAAFENPVGEILDLTTVGLDRYTWDKIDDAVRRINPKISQGFGVKNFFTVDGDKHQIKRTVG